MATDMIMTCYKDEYLPQVDKISQDDISQDTISEDNSSKDEDKFSQVYISEDDSSETDVFTRIEAALKVDNEVDFVSLIKSLSKEDSQDEIFDAYADMFYYDRIRCFAAMFAGAADPILNTDYLLAQEDNLPLHAAARTLNCPMITAFLLDHEYSANLRSDFISMDVCLKNALPLNVALETYCAYEWTGGSAIHFLTSFLGGRRTYNTIAILARNTCEIKHEFFKYLKQGKMVEVGILLAVARDCILSSSTAEGNDDMGFKDISEMHKFLSAEIEKLSVDATTAQSQCKTQLLEMKNTLELLDIFDKIGDKFIALSQITQNGTSEVESLIKDAGFDVDVLKTNSEFRRSVRLHVLDRGLLPSSFDEQEFCDMVAEYGASSKNQIPVPFSKIPTPCSVSWLPTRITITIGKAQISGGVGFNTRASGNEV